jgi:hypothetical protein
MKLKEWDERITVNALTIIMPSRITGDLITSLIAILGRLAKFRWGCGCTVGYTGISYHPT